MDDHGMIYISYRPTENYFACRVHGDEMKSAGIFDGSVAVCHKQRTAQNGDVIVSVLNGEQKVRRYRRIGESVLLCPENPAVDPIVITDADDFIILGKVVEARMAM